MIKETMSYEFNYKCTCDWSKDDDHGFIPNTNCPAHGKKTKEFLSKTVAIAEDDMEEVNKIVKESNEKVKKIQNKSEELLRRNLF